MRIVSLIASSTEMVCALGFGESLVGRSHECDFPPWVARLPAVTAPKFPTDGTSYQIDARVQAIVAEGLSVYRVDPEALDALAPDVVVTQTQCAVCAVSLSDVEDALCRTVGSRPRVAVIEWCAPLMSAGNWMPELVERAGGENLFGVSGGHSGILEWEALRAADPDVIVVSPCGFDLARTREDLPVLAALPGWSDLRAVRGGRVALADGNAYFNRPGPRLVESLAILAEIFHGGERPGAWEWV